MFAARFAKEEEEKFTEQRKHLFLLFAELTGTGGAATETCVQRGQTASRVAEGRGEVVVNPSKVAQDSLSLRRLKGVV